MVHVLLSLSQQDLLLGAAAVWDALAKVHALSLSGGESPVFADCRLFSVTVKYVIQLLYCHTLVCKHAWPGLPLHSFDSCLALCDV